LRGAVPIAEGIRRFAQTGATDYAVSETGTLITVPDSGSAATGPESRTTLVWVDRDDGAGSELPVRPDNYTMARISPDGTRVALVVGNALLGEATAIWLLDLRTNNLSLLAGGPAAGPAASEQTGADGPVWASDSRVLYFRSLGDDGIRVQSIDTETGETTVLAANSPDFPFPYPWSVSHDDNVLALVNALSLEDTNIATLALADGGGLTRLLHDERLSENEPALSPDGAWLAYHESRAITGPFEINVRPFPGVQRTRIPVANGRSPVFSRDGTELFFFDGTGIAGVPVGYEPGFHPRDVPRRLVEGPYLYLAPGRSWDVDPGGRRFLMIRQPETAVAESGMPSRPRIDVVINWVEELKARVPVR
jgi:Tol biopolymer transport system component